MTFRNDIEGLRGVAVLLVVLAHAGVPGFAGGFVGVDIFFVISGYLITGLLADELRASGRIDFWRFYARRARRLAPALLAMLVVVSALAAVALPAHALASQAASGTWAALWAANVYFAFGDFGYFGDAARDSLWLHTWSLGVEEQFYLVWPMLLLVAWRRRAGTAWLAALAVLGFAAGLVATTSDATAAYYSMPTRLWQLAIGGAVFFGLRDRAACPAAGTVGLAGIALLAAALVSVHPGVAYPGLHALLPVGGAAALIASGHGAGSPFARWLATPVLRYPGRISYSWYLWHWPLLTIWGLTGTAPPPTLVAVSVAVSFLVAAASYRWVERPMRHGTRGSPRQVIAVAVAASLAVAALFAVAGRHGVASGADDAGEEILAMIRVPSMLGDPRCDQWYESAEVVPCVVAPGPAGAPTVLLAGDSIGAQWVPAFAALAEASGARLVVLTKSSCPFVDVPFFYEHIRRRYVECEQWREGVQAWIARNRPARVFVGSAGTYGFTPEQWREGTRRVVRRIAAVTDVVVIAPTPWTSHHGLRCAMAHARREDGALRVDGCEDRLVDVEHADVVARLREATANEPNAHLLYLNDFVCPRGVCRAFADGRLWFRDQQHLNGPVVRSLAPAVAARIDRLGLPPLPPPAPDAEAVPAE